MDENILKNGLPGMTSSPVAAAPLSVRARENFIELVVANLVVVFLLISFKSGSLGAICGQQTSRRRTVLKTYREFLLCRLVVEHPSLDNLIIQLIPGLGAHRLLHALLGDEPQNPDCLCLHNPMRTVLRLQLRVRVQVEDNNRVGRLKVSLIYINSSVSASLRVLA